MKSASILLQNTLDVVANFNPDLIIFAGDREEVIMASLIGGYLEIPTIHFFGGDHVEDSHIDNPVRHATSKLSTIHFVSNEEHKKRLMALGESKHRIYNVGSVALDKFKNEQIFSKDILIKKLNIKEGFENFSIVIFHPIPKERKNSAKIFENILISLEDKHINAFVSYPNIDPGSQDIIKIIEKYKDNKNFIFYKNQPRDIFLSIYKNSEFIIGNSSSGILESASIPIPAINVGYRQTGRQSNENVLFIEGRVDLIKKAIDKVLSADFKEKIKYIDNIYGNGESSKNAYQIIKNNDFKNLIFKDEDALKVKL